MAFAATHRSLLTGATGVAGACLLAAAVSVPSAGAASARADRERHSTVAELIALGDGAGSPELLTAPEGRPVARPQGLTAAASDTAVARAHLTSVAPLFGVEADPSSLRAAGSSETPGVGSVSRFAQLVDGVPVYGAGLVVSLDESGDLVSVGGEAVPDTDLAFPVTPARAVAVARSAVGEKLELPARLLRASQPRKLAYDPSLVGAPGAGVRSVWRVVVTGPRGTAERTEVLVDATDASIASIDAGTRAINRSVCDAKTAGNASSPAADAAWQSDAAYNWCGSDTDLIVRDTNNDGIVVDEELAEEFELPPSWIDDEQRVRVPYAREENEPAVGGDADAAHAALGSASDFYEEVLGVDLTATIGASELSVDNPGGTSVRRLSGLSNYCSPAEYFYGVYWDHEYEPDDWHAAGSTLASDACSTQELEAFWADAGDGSWMPGDPGAYPGGQFVLSEGLSGALDVIGHELAHGVTSATNGLVYRNQSGAINESMSDVFGQLIQDYATGPANDPGWLLGDDVSVSSQVGALRSMSNPSTTALMGYSDGQPDSMSSPRWETDPSYDFGGVHANSGVGNKAAWLIAHGGTFNGVTVKKLDPVNAPRTQAATAKIAKLYWETQLRLPANASYRVLGATLVAACNQLVGTSGFTAADCSGSVAQAAAATRMTTSTTAMSLNRTSLKPGQTVVVSARVGDARGASVGAVGVKLQKLVGGTTRWVDAVGLSSTTSGGAKTWTVRPDRTTSYRAQYPAGGAYRGSTSVARTVAMTPTISRSVSAKKIKYKKSFKVTGKVGPRLAGRTVYLQRYSSGKWRTVKKDKLSATSAYSLRYKPKSRADRNFRVHLPGTSSYRSAFTTKFRVTVK